MRAFLLSGGRVKPPISRFARPQNSQLEKPEFLKLTAKLSALNDDLERAWSNYYDNTGESAILAEISDILTQLSEELESAVSIMEDRADSELKEAVLRYVGCFVENCNMSRQQLDYWRIEMQVQNETVDNYFQEANRISELLEATPDISKKASSLMDRIQQWSTELALFRHSRGSFLEAGQIERLAAAGKLVEAAKSTVTAALETQQEAGPKIGRVLSRTSSLASRNKFKLDSLVESFREVPGQAVLLPSPPNSLPDAVPLREPLNSYIEIAIAGDGRCLFRAVIRGRAMASGFDLSEELATAESDKARKMVVESMREQGQSLVDSCIIEEDYEAYCQKMSDSKTYAGEPELLVLTGIIEAPISVYLRSSDSFVLIQQYGGFYARTPIRILYNGRDHYNLLVPPGTNATAQSNIVSDPSKTSPKCSIM